MSTVEPNTFISVVILTARHYISGEMLFRDQRLSDFLNDRRESVVSLRNVQIARLSEPGKILQSHPAAIVHKSWAIVAFEPPQKAIPSSKRFFGYVRKQTHPVFMILEGMEVQGTLHTQGDLDLRRILAQTGDTFLPITQATVSLYTNDRFIIQQEAVMVNSNLIRYLAKVEPKSAPKT